MPKIFNLFIATSVVVTGLAFGPNPLNINADFLTNPVSTCPAGFVILSGGGYCNAPSVNGTCPNGGELINNYCNIAYNGPLNSAPVVISSVASTSSSLGNGITTPVTPSPVTVCPPGFRLLPNENYCNRDSINGVCPTGSFIYNGFCNIEFTGIRPSSSTPVVVVASSRSATPLIVSSSSITPNPTTPSPVTVCPPGFRLLPNENYCNRDSINGVCPTGSFIYNGFCNIEFIGTRSSSATPVVVALSSSSVTPVIITPTPVVSTPVTVCPPGFTLLPNDNYCNRAPINGVCPTGSFIYNGFCNIAFIGTRSSSSTPIVVSSSLAPVVVSSSSRSSSLILTTSTSVITSSSIAISSSSTSPSSRSSIISSSISSSSISSISSSSKALVTQEIGGGVTGGFTITTAGSNFRSVESRTTFQVPFVDKSPKSDVKGFTINPEDKADYLATGKAPVKAVLDLATKYDPNLAVAGDSAKGATVRTGGAY